MENTSGNGPSSVVPAEIDKWNWGAFLSSWIWGIGNRTYIAFLMFVPIFNIVMLFILGAKGSAWAWRNKKWDSIEHFKKVQRRWAVWSIAVQLSACVLILGASAYYLVDSKNNAIYQLAVQKISQDEQIAQLIGRPIEAGIPWDLVQVDEDTVTSFSFDVEGPNGEGTIWLAAKKGDTEWEILRMILVKEGGDEPPEIVDIINEQMPDEMSLQT